MENTSGNCHMKYLTYLLLIIFLLWICSHENIYAQTPSKAKKISPDLFGLFFEDINYAADGGLYAELVQNRSFEYNPTEQKDWNPFSYWEYISPGYSIGRISVETSAPVHPNNTHYIVLSIEHVGKEAQFTGDAGVGLRNSGFDGMVIRQGEKYNFSLFAQKHTLIPISFLIIIQDPRGRELARNTISISSNQWQKYGAELIAAGNSDSASLVVLAQNTGKISLDMISLFPENTFKNRPNGMRADLAQKLADLHPRFIRFPGGCLSHGDGLGNMYRWENTIGPLEQRKEQRNIWGYHQSAGLGYYEYFQFCEDIGAKALPVLPAAVSCQNSGGTWRVGGTGQKALAMDDMKDYIQEVIDLIDWANGPVTSRWGSKRAAAGHPAPFHLQYIGIGNEDKITPEFIARFKLIFNTVKMLHPEITIVGTAGPFHSGEDFEKGWKLANDLQVPVVDEHYYTSPEWFISNQHRYDRYPRNAGQVYLGEYASWGNKMRNAIAEAVYMTSLERNGDVVRMASYAPMLAKKGFTQWKTDMIFFDNVHIVLTPNYYVQKLFSANQGDIYFGNVIHKNEKDTTLAASCVRDSKSGVIILKMVNFGNTPKPMKINLSGLGALAPEAELTVLSGDADAENTFEKPQQVDPVTKTVQIKKSMEYSCPAMSLTVIRIKPLQ